MHGFSPSEPKISYEANQDQTCSVPFAVLVDHGPIVPTGVHGVALSTSWVYMAVALLLHQWKGNSLTYPVPDSVCGFRILPLMCRSRGIVLAGVARADWNGNGVWPLEWGR